jgi:hypothetical protein
MLYRAEIYVCSKIPTKHINTRRENIVEGLNEPDGTDSNR